MERIGADVTWRQVRRWRLGRQLLVDPAPDAVGAARRLCGLHAQVASNSPLIAGIRSATAPDLMAALWSERTLVRTWAMRGTLHLLPADELDLWVGALTARDSRRRFPPSFEREHGVTGPQLHAITDAVGEVLGAEPLTRAELVKAVIAHLGEPSLGAPLSAGWGSLLKPAAARGLLCSGPAADGAVTFVGAADWLRRPIAPPPADDAERFALLRFLAANGPATAGDIARWWGEQPGPAKRWLRTHSDVLAAVTVDGEPGYVVRAEDADELAATPDGGTHPADGPVFLPGFDPWVISPLTHRARAIPEGHTADVSRTAGWITPVLVSGGTVAGVWEHDVRDGEATISVRTFGRVAARERKAAEAHAQRYGPLFDASTVRVVWG